MKKKFFLIVSAVALAFTGLSVFAITSNKHSLFNAFADHTPDASCYWNHYSYRAPTTNYVGCNEYWVCCEHHEFFFTEPTVGRNLDAAPLEVGVETLQYLADKPTDPRYIAKLEDVTRDDEVIDFDEEIDLNLITDGGRPAGRNEFSWLESFQGETGILKVHTMDDMPRIQLNGFAHEKSYYNSYDEITFKMYLEHKGSGDYHHMWLQTETAPMYYFNGGQAGGFTYDDWAEYTFPIARFFDAEFPSLIFYTETFEAWANIYIADIKVSKIDTDTPRDNEIMDFDEESDLTFVSDAGRPAGRNEFSWLETYQGETGVLKVHTQDDNPLINVSKYAHEKSHYASYSFVVFKMWLDHKGANDYHHIYLNGENGDMYYFNGGGAGPIVYEKWVEYSFSIDKLTSADALGLHMYNDNFGSWANVYISDIRVTNARPPLDRRVDEVNGFNQESDLNMVTFGDRPEGRNEFSWVETFQGEYGVLKNHTMDDNPRIKLTSFVHDKDDYSTYDLLVFKMYIDLGDKTNYHHIYMNSDEGTAYRQDGASLGAIVYGEWFDFKFPIVKFYEAEQPELRMYNEYYELFANVYIADIRVENLPTDPARDNEVIDFNEEADLNSVTYGDRPSDRAEAPVLLDDYQGETGVLKVRTMDDNPRIRITNYARDLADYSNYNFVVVRMWLEHKGANDYHHIYLNEEAGDMYYFNGGGAGPIAYEQWVDFSFAISELRSGGFEIRMYNENYGSWANVYISDIRVVETKPPLTRRADEVIGFNLESDLNFVTYGDRPSDRAEAPVWLDSYDGEQGVLKVRTMDDLPRIRITNYMQSLDSYDGNTKVVVRMWLEHKGANDYHHIYLNEEAGDMYYFNGGGAGPITYEQWVDFSFAISELRSGGFEIRMYNENYGSWANVYISDIRVVA